MRCHAVMIHTDYSYDPHWLNTTLIFLCT
jgi:hypothetical protein